MREGIPALKTPLPFWTAWCVVVTQGQVGPGQDVLIPIIDEVVPLADGAAQRRLAAGRQFGKIVLRI